MKTKSKSGGLPPNEDSLVGGGKPMQGPAPAPSKKPVKRGPKFPVGMKRKKPGGADDHGYPRTEIHIGLYGRVHPVRAK